ncbi:interferon lambda-1-like [Suncus etruscus]|uniref:interferon lambda-1-like n=1 Tax=Suncus etruscus TaxID=109475 RepID=UPI00210FD46D|nr:interferon lambda-1-like [Suncus etruscus]
MSQDCSGSPLTKPVMKDVPCFFLLVVVELGLAKASPVPTSNPLPGQQGCDMGRFKTLPPSELAAFKKAKDALEEMVLQKGWNCTTRLFPRNWNLRKLQLWERHVALEAELALTLQVLGALAESSLGPVLAPALHTLSLIHAHLQICLHTQPKVEPHPQDHLHRWLERLQESGKKESPSCLEASVTFHLFHLLIKGLKCVTPRDLCV